MKNIFYKRMTLIFAFALMVMGEPYALADQAPPHKVFLMEYLITIGAKLDCYFTLEWNQQDGYTFNAINTTNDLSVDSIKTLIEKFHREMPNIEVIQDAENPAIVHLITRAMKKSKNQILNEKATIHFKETVRKLPDEIGKHTNGGIGQAKFVIVPMVTPDDLLTVVEVQAKNRPIRSILSDYMPLAHYATIIWLAFDQDINNNRLVQIFYYGFNWLKPYSGNAQDKTKIYPFSDGRNACFLNPLSEKLTDEAAKFITDGFQSGKTLNVRWSMYYLGRNKVESAIPLLLEHLDYRYTTVPVLAEAYPAVHALLDMGKPATAAVQKQLTTETDPLRLELLCAVLLGIHGAYDGRRLTAETAAKLPEAREKPIMDALRIAEEQIIAVPPPVDNVYSPHPAPLAP